MTLHRPVAVVSRQPGQSPALVLVTAAGALLVVYGNLVGRWTDDHGEHLWLLSHLRHWLNRPLGIGEDFGVLGVMLLLLVSGYTAAAAAEQNPDRRAVVAGLWRAYAPVLASTLLAAALVAAGAPVWTSPADPPAGFANLITSLTLASAFVPGEPALVPLAWLVAVELICVITTVAVAALTRRQGVPLAWLAPVVQLILVAAVLATGGGAFRQAVVVLSFVPLAAIGSLIRSTTAGHTSIWLAIPLGVAGWEMISYAEAHNATLAGWWYPVTAAYAVAIFLTAMLVAGPTATTIARWRSAGWLATRARWLILLLGVVGYPVMALSHRHLPLSVALLTAAVATGGAAELGQLLESLADRWRRRLGHEDRR